MQQRLRVDVVHVLRPCPLPGCTQSVWVWQVAPSQGKLKRGPPCCKHLPAASLEVLRTEAWHALDVEKPKGHGSGVCCDQARGTRSV